MSQTMFPHIITLSYFDILIFLKSFFNDQVQIAAKVCWQAWLNRSIDLPAKFEETILTKILKFPSAALRFAPSFSCSA